MKSKLIQLLIAVAIIVLGIGAMLLLIFTKPEAKKEALAKSVPAVQVLAVQQQSVKPILYSQSEFLAPRQTTVSAQVMGKVISVSDQYEAGGKFSKGEVICQLEKIDYETALISAQAAEAQARSTVKEAEVALELEQARVAQALRDWKKLGKKGEPTELLLRKPQIASAEARLQASRMGYQQAQSQVMQAKRNLERTSIKAPYDCQIERKRVDLGALVTVGMPLVDLFQTGSVEARLPISLEDTPYVVIGAKVKATAQYGAIKKEWIGEVVRDEQRIDAGTRSNHVVATFTGADLPTVGLFAKMEIEGAEIAGVHAVPRIVLNGQDRVIVIDQDDRVTFREVVVLRTTQSQAYISEGLQNGERVCLTMLNTPVEGTDVKVIE